MKKNIGIISFILIAFIVGYFVGDSSAIKRANEQLALVRLQYELEAASNNSSETKQVISNPVQKDSNESITNVVEKDNKEEPKDEWKEVIVFEGKSIKDTETFKISSKEWRIIWETEPGDIGEMNFQIYVYDKDGNPAGSFIVANIIGKGDDVSYMRGDGEYYLTINTAQSYKIIIEEK